MDFEALRRINKDALLAQAAGLRIQAEVRSIAASDVPSVPLPPPIEPPVEPPTKPPEPIPDPPPSNDPPVEPPPTEPLDEALRAPWAHELWERLQHRTHLEELDPDPAGGMSVMGLGAGSPGYEGKPTLMRAGWREAIHIGSNRPGSAIEDMTLRDIDVVPAFAPPKSKWGLCRGYNVVRFLVENCAGRDIHQEHFVYLNPIGDVTFRNVLVRDCGGQALQLVNRESSSSQGDAENNPWVAGGVITVNGLLSYQNGVNPGRGSFPLTITNIGRKDRPCSVFVEKYGCYTRWPTAVKESGSWIRSRGGFLIESDGTDYHGIDVLEMKDFYVSLESNAQETARIGGVKDGLIEGGEFIQENSGRFIEIDKLDGREGAWPSKRIVWRGNKGNVLVRLRGKVVGSCDEDMVFEGGLRVS